MSVRLPLCVLVLACASFAGAADKDITPAQQKLLEAQQKTIAAWAADPLVVAAVKAQNDKGPLPGMDNPAWKATPRSDEKVKAFQTSPAGQFLIQKLKESNGLFTEAFLNAAQGEKVAFAEKTTSYIHKGSAKFDVPFSGKTWQGKPEFDESSQTYAIQIAAPVLDGGKPIGVLVVGVALEQLAQK